MLKEILKELQRIKKTLQSIDNKLESQTMTVMNTINSPDQLTAKELQRQTTNNLRQIAERL